MAFSQRTLRSILARHTPTVTRRRDAVRYARGLTTQLEPWGNRTIVRASIFGSVAKGTDLVGGADVDVFVSLSSRTAGTLSEMRESLFRWLKHEKRYVVRRQNVSIRVLYGSTKIDVVPAKRLNEYSNDHYLWSRDGHSRTKTNIGKQIQRVRSSRRQHEIRLAKIWRTSHGLECPSFLLELAVIRALHRRRRGQTASNFQTVLEYLASTFPRARLTDPGNSANVVSHALDDAQKRRIAAAARSSLLATSTARVFGPGLS